MNSRLFFDEVQPYYERGQSLIIYQHGIRTGKLKMQARTRLKQLSDEVGCDKPFAMHYCGGTARLFLMIPQTKHRHRLIDKAEEMIHGPWGKHFEMLEF